MVTIRLSRSGAKKRPFYHIVVTDSRRSRDGRFIERLGYFNPIASGKERRLSFDTERTTWWIDRGARPSDRVASLIKEAGREPATEVAEAPAKPEANAESPKAEAAPKAGAAEAKSEAKAEQEADEARPEVKAEQPKAEDVEPAPEAAQKSAEPKQETAVESPDDTKGETAAAKKDEVKQDAAQSEAKPSAGDEAESAAEGERAEGDEADAHK
ncbi:MAG: 30S ribosomal protein S16 [Gammaproteobacteria bacterium]